MISRERVIAVIKHKRPDRTPIYGWVKANLSEIIEKAFGSVENFEDKYEFDFAEFKYSFIVYLHYIFIRYTLTT